MRLCMLSVGIYGIRNWRNQTIIQSNGDDMCIEPLGTNFSEVQIKMQKFSFKKNAYENTTSRMLVIFFNLQCAVCTYHIAPWYKEAGPYEAMYAISGYLGYA